MAEQMAMLHDVSKCTACRACMVACKQWKNLPAEITPFDGAYQSHKDFSSKTYNLVRMNERVENGKFHWDFIKVQCMHCENPACLKGCPEDAISKTATGAVVIDKDKCVGCGYCVINCPFDVPKIDEATHKSTKCNMCADRIENGMVPSCAQTCPPTAIQFGPRDKMVALANTRLTELKKDFPNAQLYGVDANGVGGTNMMYILTDKPAVYGLPADPKTSTAMNVWKDIIRPIGQVAGVAAIVGCAGAYTLSKFVAKRHKDNNENGKGGDGHVG
ncbi:4Fe-4S dicluster domain-containing protein [Anaerosinus massiliensis]|uniref:4Fe-4S dicluster domain-containing protein n=1 Tax=Massilibacillus massiliensis TaxID=1806837 RepID=UPI000DA60533|nr:4Fe-4S dicluster domain-containing protein [Massilibacillus massiliensis]